MRQCKRRCTYSIEVGRTIKEEEHTHLDISNALYRYSYYDMAMHIDMFLFSFEMRELTKNNATKNITINKKHVHMPFATQRRK